VSDSLANTYKSLALRNSIKLCQGQVTCWALEFVTANCGSASIPSELININSTDYIRSTPQTMLGNRKNVSVAFVEATGRRISKVNLYKIENLFLLGKLLVQSKRVNLSLQISNSVQHMSCKELFAATKP
jgi:hypothetical protein